MDILSSSPQADFPEFYENPFIKHIAKNRRWTISDKDKRPIHMGDLLQRRRIVGTRPDDPTGMLTLPELTSLVPTAANASFHFDGFLEQALILDIESDCPEDLRDVLLTLVPQSFYSEVSRSGKGYHLVMPMPGNFSKFKDASRKSKVQHHHRYFEVLIHHWISFTRTPIPDEILSQSEKAPTIEWDDLYQHLATTVKGHKQLQGSYLGVAELPSVEGIPQAKEALAWILRYEYKKDLNDFGGDTSRWEFGVIHHLIRSIYRWGGVSSYQLDQITSVIYYAVLKSIPHRDKHDTLRNGNPFLLSQVQKAMEMVAAESQASEV